MTSGIDPIEEQINEAIQRGEFKRARRKTPDARRQEGW
jgi:hypothetical protein